MSLDPLERGAALRTRSSRSRSRPTFPQVDAVVPTGTKPYVEAVERLDVRGHGIKLLIGPSGSGEALTVMPVIQELEAVWVMSFHPALLLPNVSARMGIRGHFESSNRTQPWRVFLSTLRSISLVIGDRDRRTQ